MIRQYQLFPYCPIHMPVGAEPHRIIVGKSTLVPCTDCRIYPRESGPQGRHPHLSEQCAPHPFAQVVKRDISSDNTPALRQIIWVPPACDLERLEPQYAGIPIHCHGASDAVWMGNIVIKDMLRAVGSTALPRGNHSGKDHTHRVGVVRGCLTYDHAITVSKTPRYARGRPCAPHRPWGRRY